MCEQKLAFIGPFWSGNLDLKLRLKSLGLIILGYHAKVGL